MDDALFTAMRQVVAGTVGAVVANKVGQAYDAEKIDAITHKVSHAFLGGAVAAILSDNPKKDIAAGALAGAVSETLVEVLRGDLEKVVEDAHKDTGSKQEAKNVIDAWVDRQADMAKLLTVGALGVLGHDVDILQDVADNALKNNFVMLAFTIASAVSTAYDVYEAYREGGIEAAAEALAMDMMMSVAGGMVIKGVGKALKTAMPYIQKHLPADKMGSLLEKLETSLLTKAKNNPALAKVMEGWNHLTHELKALIQGPNHAYANMAHGAEKKAAAHHFEKAAEGGAKKAGKAADIKPKPAHEVLQEAREDWMKPNKLTQNQRNQLKDINLYGKNPGNVKPDSKKGIEKLFVDTELRGTEQTARDMFKKLTGETVPNVLPKKDYFDVKIDKTTYVFRPLGDSGHPKLEIKDLTTGRLIHEKISFKIKE